MNNAFEKENEHLLMKLKDIHTRLGEAINSIGGELKQKSPAEIQKKILEIKARLKSLKTQHNQSIAIVKELRVLKNRTIEEKVQDLEIKSLIKKEVKALDKAITKVTRAEKYCNSTLDKVKVDLLSAELSCFEVIKANLELDKVIHK